MASTARRLALMMAGLVLLQVGYIVYVAGGLGGVTSANHEQRLGHLLTVYLLMAIGVVVLRSLVSFVAARSLNARLGALAEVTERIAAGDLATDAELVVHEYDEVGRAAGSIRTMLGELQDIAAHARRIASGDLSGDLPPRSEHDELRRALAGMTDGLRAMVGDVSAAADKVSAVSDRVAAEAADSGRSVDEIARAVGDVASGAERQVRSVEAVRGLSAEVASTTETSAGSAQEAAGEAGRAQALADS